MNIDRINTNRYTIGIKKPSTRRENSNDESLGIESDLTADNYFQDFESPLSAFYGVRKSVVFTVYRRNAITGSNLSGALKRHVKKKSMKTGDGKNRIAGGWRAVDRNRHVN